MLIYKLYSLNPSNYMDYRLIFFLIKFLIKQMNESNETLYMYKYIETMTQWRIVQPKLKLVYNYTLVLSIHFIVMCGIQMY